MTNTATGRRQYLLSFASGTTRHDEKRYAYTITALTFTEAAARAKLIGDRKGWIVTGVELVGGLFA